MNRIPLGEAELSSVVLGLWRLTDYGDSSPRALRERIEAALEQGITSLDQADIYGGYASEEALGDCLRAAPGLRDRVEIVTKCGIVAPAGRHSAARVKHYDTGAAHVAASVEASLTLLGTDRIDLLLIHRPDPMMDHEETGACLDRLVASGKVRAVGASNFRPWDWELLQSAMSTRLAANQVELGLARPGPFSDGDVAFHQRLGTPIMAWSPLGGGALMSGDADPALASALDRIAAGHGVGRAAVALAWLLAHPARILPVVGTNRIERIRAISDCIKVELDRQAWFELYSAALGREVP